MRKKRKAKASKVKASKVKGPSLQWQVDQLARELEDLKEKTEESYWTVNELRNSMVYISRLPGQYGDIEKALLEIREIIQK